MRSTFAALACAILMSTSGASAQTYGDPRLEPMAAHYARLTQAYADNDAAMILAYRTPDFYVETPGGGRIESDVAAQILVDFLATTAPPIQQRAEVLCATVAGESEAAFTVVQHLTRNTELNGAPHQLETAVTQTETWRLTTDGWRLASVVNMRNPRRWVDGTEIDPNRPYDPRARPYQHREAAPEFCATPLPQEPPAPGLE